MIFVVILPVCLCMLYYQTDRQTDRQVDGRTEGQTDSERKGKQRQTVREGREEERDRDTDICTKTHTFEQTYPKIDRQTDRWIEKRANRQRYTSLITRIYEELRLKPELTTGGTLVARSFRTGNDPNVSSPLQMAFGVRGDLRKFLVTMAHTRQVAGEADWQADSRNRQ